MTVHVERFTGPADEWDDFVRKQDGASHCHLIGWRDVISRVFGHECVYLAARDQHGELAAVMPLVRVRSLVFGHYLVSMPFLNYGGPVGRFDAVRALVAEASALASAARVKLLELRSRVQLDVPLRASHRKITVLLDLPGSADVLFSRLTAKLRSQIRRPQKEGVRVAFGADQVQPFFDVFARHMRDLGTPTQPLRFFAEIARSFPDDSLFACAYLGDIPVAAGCGFRFGPEFEMTWASSLRAYNRQAPNMLLYWSCMRRAIADGATVFNFGRCSPGSGTHHFKMQWGGREVPLWWYGLSASEGVTTPSPDSGAYSWGPRMWRRLPTSITTALGPSIVRCIP